MYRLYLLPIAIIKIFVMRLFFKYVDYCKSPFKEHSGKTLSLSKSLKKKLLSIVFKGNCSKRRDQTIQINKSSQKPLVFTTLNLAKPFKCSVYWQNISVFHGSRGGFLPETSPMDPFKSGTLKLCSDPEKPSDLGKWVATP